MPNAKILIADDVAINRHILVDLLTPLGYETIEAENGKQVIEKASTQNPDLILLDLIMPEMDGVEACRFLKTNPRTKMIPVVVITALSDDQNHLRALEAGADDFLSKPYNINFIRARLKSLLTMKMLYDLNLKYQDMLKKSNVKLMQEVIRTQDATIVALAKLAEFRDPETGEHLERMREYIRLLTVELQKTPKFGKFINEQYIEYMLKSTPLHDIGKVGIPDSILLKPGKLTPEEFDIMKRHTTLGGDAIGQAIKLAGLGQSFLEMGRDIAYYHHEKWDGTGYPKGLKKDQIPLCARITALADVYDALTTKRVYKPALSHEESKNIIIKNTGTAFDPDVINAFSKLERSFFEIKESIQDRNL